METPYDLPWLIVGIFTGLLSGSLSPGTRLRLAIQIFVIAIGTYVCWRLSIQSVQWAYDHPFNPNDGAAKTFVYLFGWLIALVLVILPSFGLTTLIRYLYKRQKINASAT